MNGINLQGLIDFYHAMVPTTAKYDHRRWDVVYCGRQVEGEKTPADYEMEDGDQLCLFPVTKASFGYETDDDDDEFST
ncbi:hypothetical protein E2562_008928 [Oryza meyeriana var. granulata]|uniref:Ubiquitin-like domain-containing protein n=1 Tax=Oryza meyeriana var. granulata TaxID=110450 RepID=A0A6G1D0L3_9ORYZ|nr:hypothetical protein E2562_008928 [Oryza meyeriana var. granulata]